MAPNQLAQNRTELPSLDVLNLRHMSGTEEHAAQAALAVADHDDAGHSGLDDILLCRWPGDALSAAAVELTPEVEQMLDALGVADADERPLTLAGEVCAEGGDDWIGFAGLCATNEEVSEGGRCVAQLPRPRVQCW